MITMISKISKETWSKMSENAHLVVFGNRKELKNERIDFTYLIAQEAQVLAYVTCKEMDGTSLYWQYGGTFPSAKGSIFVPAGFRSLLNRVQEDRYDRVSFLVENTNYPMLKLAMAFKFKIIGAKLFQGQVFLEHCLEFGGN